MGYCEVPLGKKTLKAIIDDSDYELVSKYKWQAGRKKTPHSTNKIYDYVIGRVNGKLTSLHKFIMNTPKGMYVDHANGNGLDNRRSNLRVCTQSQNIANQAPRGTYKGVTIHKDKRCDGSLKPKRKIYQARIKVNYKYYSLGYFYTPEEAAKAYDKAAIKHFGEFANLNFKEKEKV